MSAGEQVQVGWYCNHEVEKKDAPYAGSHMSSHGKFRKKKGWIETFPEPHTTKSLSFTDYHDPSKPPHCPLAVPVYIDVPTTQAHP